jgi:hypothetical protein
MASSKEGAVGGGEDLLMGRTTSPRGGTKGRHYQDIKDSRKQEKPEARVRSFTVDA